MRSDTPADENRLEPGHAPTPFSAEEIRRACAPGRVNTFRLEVPDEPGTLRTIRFTGGDESAAEFESSRTTGDGEPIGEPQRARTTWAELQSHASFPEASVAVTNESIEIPAGEFECWLYTVAGDEHGAAAVMRFWFAKDLPGPPVRTTHEIDGKLVMTSTLVAYERP